MQEGIRERIKGEKGYAEELSGDEQEKNHYV